MRKDKRPKADAESATTSSKSANNVEKTSDDSENQKLKNPSRRAFIGQVSAAGLVAGGLLILPGALGKTGSVSAQTQTDCISGCELVPQSGVARADAAKQRRFNAAIYERNMPIPSHPCNGDEQLYFNQNYFASYVKGMKRANGVNGDTFGEVDSAVYCTYLNALNSGSPAAFEQILLGFSNNCASATVSDEASRLAPLGPLPPNRQRRLESPQAGYNFDLEGKDYYQLINRPPGAVDPPVAFPPAFTFASAEEAVEIIENYWQAVTRDVAFIDYGSSSLVSAAATDIGQFAQFYKGPIDPNSPSDPGITPQVYSRGILSGDITGPFVSQFLLRDNIPYGAQTIRSLIKSPAITRFGSPTNDFMTAQPEWLMIQKGQTPNRTIAIDGMRYIRNGRDLANYVRNDAIYQAYLNAALLLSAPQDSGGLGVPLNPNNPYRIDVTSPSILRYCKQLNFVEFGPSQLLSLLGEVSVRAHKAVWYQKWQVHRRLRPEEFGGRVHFNFELEEQGFEERYPINPILRQSSVFSRIRSTYGSWFLPQAYPEGSPLHPAYGAGHATLAGACVTILKAWFDSEQPYANYGTFVQANANGDALIPSGQISNTVADELNKLASNISIGRNIGGVHWRSDYTESVFLGEQVAIQLLADYGFTYNEDFLGFSFRDFNGNLITVGEKRTI